MATTRKRKSRNSTRETTARASHDIDPTEYQQAAQASSQQQLAMAADTTSALIRGAEIWSQLQLQALQRSGQAWREAAERLRTAASPWDLMNVQSQLMMKTMQQFMGFAQDFMQSTMAMQARETARTTEQSSSAVESMAAPMMPMMQAWQAMLNPMGLNGAVVADATRH